MKKFCFALCVSLCFFSESVIAQYNQKVIGAKTGFGNISILNQNNYGQREMDYGPIYGISGGISFSAQIGLSNYLLIEGLWRQGGQDYEDQFSGATFAKQLDFELIEIPILFQHFFGSSNNEEDRITELPTGFYFLAGLSASFLQKAEFAHQIDGSDVDFATFYLQGGNAHQTQIQASAETKGRDLYGSVSAGVVGGFGYQTKLSEKVLFLIELRGGVSVTDINAEEWRLANKENKYDASRHGYLMLMAGLGFGI